MDQLVAKLAGVVMEANARLVEATLGAGEGFPKANIGRWVMTPQGAKWAPNPEAPVDDTLSVLRVNGPRPQPLAVLVNYAAHASVMAWGKSFSADYPGFLQGVLEQVYGAETTALFANGASGDLKVNWVIQKPDGSPDFGYGKVEDARRWGTLLAGEALKVSERMEVGDPGEIRIASTEVTLPLRPLPSVASVEAELKAKQEKGEETDWEERVLPSLRDGTAPQFLTGEVQVLRVGHDIAFVAVPGELFAEVGLRMRKELGCRHLFIVGYANGYVGYLPSARSIREDGDTMRYDWHKCFWYPSHLAPEVEPVLCEAVCELFAETGRCADA